MPSPLDAITQRDLDDARAALRRRFAFVDAAVRDDALSTALTRAAEQPAPVGTGWLVRTAGRVLIDQYRRASAMLDATRWTEVDAAMPAGERSALDALVGDETATAVRQAVAALPERERVVLLEHVVEDASLREISVRHRWARGIAWRAKESALGRLRAALGAELVAA
jgi:DNA-directed RNA polymerase specialized sigma24 family protein